MRAGSSEEGVIQKKVWEIVEKWQRACVILNNCQACPDRVECLPLARNAELLGELSLWKKEQK